MKIRFQVNFISQLLGIKKDAKYRVSTGWWFKRREVSRLYNNPKSFCITPTFSCKAAKVLSKSAAEANGAFTDT